jgi:cytochrome d ubiquinol oxidase subunit I
MHRAAVLMGPAGFVAVLAGWITTEVGRQPYTIYGLLTTVQSASPIQAAAIGSSLVAFILVYFALFGAGAFYIARLMNMPPEAFQDDLSHSEPIRAGGIMPAPILGSSSALSSAK